MPISIKTGNSPIFRSALGVLISFLLGGKSVNTTSDLALKTRIKPKILHEKHRT